VVLIAALALAGCNSGSEDEAATNPVPPPGRDEPSQAKTIRDWSRALNDERYGRAASFFAKGAIVEQARVSRLADRAAAIAFNRSLPCKADVTDIDDEGDTVLVAFRLRGGPRGGCQGGSARVRFKFRGGKFSEWRQLGAPDAPPGEVI